MRRKFLWTESWFFFTPTVTLSTLLRKRLRALVLAFLDPARSTGSASTSDIMLTVLYRGNSSPLRTSNVPGGLWVTLWFLILISPSATRRQIGRSNDRSSVVLYFGFLVQYLHKAKTTLHHIHVMKSLELHHKTVD